MATRAQQIAELTGPFFDGDGTQVSVPYAKFYIAGGAGSANTKDAYADINKSVSFTKKQLSAESNNIYGDGIYDIELYSGDPDAGGVKVQEFTNRKYVANLGATSTKTADYTSTIDDALILVDTTTSDVTITLPDAAEAIGRTIVIKKTTSDANTLTIAAASGQLVDNAASLSGTNQNYAAIVISDGTGWYGTAGDADTLGGVPASGFSKGTTTTTLVTATDAAWEPTAGALEIEFTAIGGGGGGGGIDGQGAGTGVSGRSGSGGSWAVKTTTQIEASYNITIGAGGSGGAAGDNPGGDGGDTTVASTNVNINGKGGLGGAGRTGLAGNQASLGTDAGPVGTGGDINGRGLPATGAGANGGSPTGISNSGCCPLIGGGQVSDSSQNGNNGEVYGEGGSSAYDTDSASNFAGGDGFQGVVIVKETF